MALTFMDYLLNNAAHFHTYGSDMPTAALAPIVARDTTQFIHDLPTLRNDARKTNEVFVGGADNNPSDKPYPLTASGITPHEIEDADFINADLAKHYGMTKATAYQEALSNTAYQRSVKDMKAAGLNPAVLFGSGRATASSASIYASEQSSGGGGRRSSGALNDKLFSGSAYSALSAIGGLVGLVATKRPDGYWIGSQTTQGIMGLLNSVADGTKK